MVRQYAEAWFELLHRLQLIAAVEGDDWSAIIDSQTALTESPRAAVAPPVQQISSPFSRARVHSSIGATPTCPIKLIGNPRKNIKL